MRWEMGEARKERRRRRRSVGSLGASKQKTGTSDTETQQREREGADVIAVNRRWSVVGDRGRSRVKALYI